MGGRTGHHKGAENYKNEVLICSVLDILPNCKYGWQAVALAYQEAAQEDEVRNTDELDFYITLRRKLGHIKSVSIRAFPGVETHMGLLFAR
jgi:hypothetical protein